MIDYSKLITAEQKAAKAREDLKQKLKQAVQNYLDATARAKGYDDIVSACSYAGAPNAFQAESQKFLAWRGDCWTKAFQIQGNVEAGLRPIPTEAELIAELPKLELS